jgi:hypothetical protein
MILSSMPREARKIFFQTYNFIWFSKENTNINLLVWVRIQFMSDLGFSQRWLWRIKICITPCRPLKVNDVSKKHTASISACHLLSRWYLARFFRAWKWRRYIPPKRRLTLNRLHGDLSQKIVLFNKIHVCVCSNYSLYVSVRDFEMVHHPWNKWILFPESSPTLRENNAAPIWLEQTSPGIAYLPQISALYKIYLTVVRARTLSFYVVMLRPIISFVHWKRLLILYIAKLEWNSIDCNNSFLLIKRRIWWPSSKVTNISKEMLHAYYVCVLSCKCQSISI